MEDKFDHPVLSEIHQALEDIEAAEALRDEAIVQLQEAIKDLPYKIGRNTELREEILTHLYWNEEFIRPTWLAKAFDTTVHRIKDIAAQPSMIPCRECGEPMRVNITSRSGEVRWQESTCQECKEKRSNQSREREVHYAQQQERISVLRTMPYYEYLQTPEWQERRKYAMKRAGYRCQVCNAYGVKLNTHHRTYERRGNEQDRDLITLCQDCHCIFHENGKLAEED